MREIQARKIIEAVKNLCVEANYSLGEDVEKALNKGLAREESPLGREVLRQLIKNAELARKEKIPLCQDTGAAVVFVEIGKNAKVMGGNLYQAIHEGVSRGYKEGYLRKSMVGDPLTRKNTGDNTPALIHTEIVPGEKLKLTLMAKGGGAENCGAIKMFKPTALREEIDQFVLEKVIEAGPNPCPPIIVGLGVGGNFELAPLLAKKALLRPLDRHNSARMMAGWEKELLEKINKTGIGPGGLGGRITALAVNIETYPCHLSTLPVALNFDCHAHRVKSCQI